MKPKVLVVLLGLVLLLAGCSSPTGSQVSAHINGGATGFEVDDEGKIVIMLSNVTFFNQAGASEAVIDSYTVRFVNEAGNPIPGLDYPLINEGGISITVPAGMYCGEEAVGPCNAFNGGVPRRMASEPHNLATLPGEVAVHMVFNDQYPVYALVTFYGTQGIGFQRQISFNANLTVVNPFGGEE